MRNSFNQFFTAAGFATLLLSFSAQIDAFAQGAATSFRCTGKVTSYTVDRSSISVTIQGVAGTAHIHYDTSGRATNLGWDNGLLPMTPDIVNRLFLLIDRSKETGKSLKFGMMMLNGERGSCQSASGKKIYLIENN